MTKDKKIEFLTTLEKLLYNYGSGGIKLSVNDSIYNNRTASVNQVIRFLKVSPVKGHRQLGRRLVVAYSLLKPTMNYNRKVRGRRSDAFDYGEFKRTLTAFIAAEQVARAVEYSI